MSTQAPETPGGPGRLRHQLLESLQNDLQIAQDMTARLSGDVTSAATSSVDNLRQMLHQLSRDARVAVTELDAAMSYDRAQLLKAGREQLGEWRAALDDIRVQADLGGMDAKGARDQVVATAERAWSVAQQRLDTARDDVGSSFETMRSGLEDALRQVGEAVRAAVRVVAAPPPDQDEKH